MAGRDAVPVTLGPLAVRIGVKSLAAADEIRGRLFTAALPRRTNSTARSSRSARAASTKACASPRRDEGGVGERIFIRIGEHTHARKEGFGRIAT